MLFTELILSKYYLHNSYFNDYFLKLIRKIFFFFFLLVNKHYQKHKERLQKEARERYQNLPEEEKDERRKKARERYQNFTEEKKEKRYQY